MRQLAADIGEVGSEGHHSSISQVKFPILDLLDDVTNVVHFFGITAIKSFADDFKQNSA